MAKRRPATLRSSNRALPSATYPLTRLGASLFGAANVASWKVVLGCHFQSDLAFNKDERGLRENHRPTAKVGAAILLEWTLEETFRAILGIRKGRKRRSNISAMRLRSYKFSRTRLILEAPGKAVTIYNGVREEHEVDGIVGINCTVSYRDGTFFRKVRSRFVSHPFWQLGVSVAPATSFEDDEDEDDEAEDND